MGFPDSSVGKESACNSGDLGSIPGLGRPPGEGKGYPLQYSGLENAMGCIVHEVAKSWTWLSDFHFHCNTWFHLIFLFTHDFFFITRSVLQVYNMPVLDLSLSKPCALLTGTDLIFTITQGHDWSDFACMHALEKEMAAHSSVLENPRDRGAWWTAVYGVTQSQTWLKWLSSSSSSSSITLGHASGKELTCQCTRSKRCRFNSWVRKIAWRKAWQQPTPVFLPGEFHGQRSLAGYSPCGRKQPDMTEATEHACRH